MLVSHGRIWSDNHPKSFTPELVQSFSKVERKIAHFNNCGDCLTTHDRGFCCETLHQFWCETFAVIVVDYVLRQSLSWSALVVCHSEQMLATNLFSEKSSLRACPLADKFRIFLQLTKRKPTFVSCQFLLVSLHPN